MFCRVAAHETAPLQYPVPFVPKPRNHASPLTVIARMAVLVLMHSQLSSLLRLALRTAVLTPELVSFAACREGLKSRSRVSKQQRCGGLLSRLGSSRRTAAPGRSVPPGGLVAAAERASRAGCAAGC